MKGNTQQSECSHLGGSRWAVGTFLSPTARIATTCIAAVFVVLCVIVAPALADEGGDVPGQPYPLSGVEEGTASPAAFLDQLIDSDAAKELPHRDLNRDEASELAEAVFGSLLEGSAGPFGDLQVEQFLGDSAAIVAPGVSDAAVTIGGEKAAEEEAKGADGPLLMESTLPLRTENNAGQDRIVDLDLEHDEGELQPVNPLIDVGIPDELGEGVELPSGSIELETGASAEERAPSVLAGNVAFYPNVARDTDFAVATTPTGIETFTQLRSADAPTSQTLNLELDPGVTLEESSEGGAVAMSGAEEVLKVMPPTALDANGNNVPVSLEVSDGSLVLNTTTDEDTAFPVLVDPVIIESWPWYEKNTSEGMDSGNGTGTGDWRSWRNTTAFSATYNVPWSTPPAPLKMWMPGLTVTSGYSGTVSVGSQANWNYYVPRYFTDYEKFGTRPTSFIQNMQMWNLQYATYSSQADPWLATGLWDENLGKWVSVYSRNGTSGSIGEKYWTMLYNFPNGEYVQSVKNAGFGLLSSEAGQNSGRLAYVGYAALSLNDLTNPSIGEFSGTRWMNTSATEAVKVTASDSGLGAKSLRFEGEAGDGTFTITNECKGTAKSPCPRNWSAEWKGYPAATLSTGIHYYTTTASDVVENKSATAKIPVRIDHTAPSLTLSGTMTEQASLGYQRPQYVLHLNGADGTTTSPQAGIASSEITVDGKVVDTSNPGCATQNCALSRDWTLSSSSFTAGQHSVVASATDGAGITTTKSLTVKIEKDTTAPTLANTGNLRTAPDGWVEQQSYNLNATASDAGYGLTSLVAKIDGKQVASWTSGCVSGGCKATISKALDMSAYVGGSHPAEVIATDGAGNVSKDSWTVNVNPKGTVPSSEATDTIEAVEETTESSALAPTSEVVESAEIEAGNDPALAVEGANIISTGTGADSSMTADAGNGFTIDNGEETFHIEPTKSTTTETNLEIVNGAAGVAANTTNGVDSIVRPVYDGIMAFQSIRTSAAPETYSWTVQLHEEQELKAIDEEHVGIFYPDGTQALTITAEIAYDATGKQVPTSLGVSEGKTLTLTVDHQGGGFTYPISAGPTWQTGYQTVIVEGPPTKEEEEQKAAEEKAAEEIAQAQGETILAAVSAPQFAGCPDTGEACASSGAPYRTYAFWACSSAPWIGCNIWEERIKGFFYYNGSKAWMSKRQPKCSHQAGPTFSVSEDYCSWVGPDNQPYGGGYHITSQVRYNVSALQVQTSSQKFLTVRMYGSGNPYVTPSSNICNPSKPSCA